MRLLHLFSFILILSITGCGGNEPTGKLPKLSLNLEKLNITKEIGRAYSLKTYSDYLIIRDDKVGTKLTLFKLSDLKKSYNAGITGQGPGELINPGPMIIENNTIKIYDGSKKKLLLFHTDSILKNAKYKPAESTAIGEDGIMDIAPINDQNYLVVGAFPLNRYSIIDNKGHSIFKTGDYPIALPEGVPDYIRPIACQSMLSTNPGKSLAAVAMRYGEVIQFLKVDLEKQKINEIAKHEAFLPEFTTREIGGFPNFSPSEKTRWGYLSITSDNNHVYALYSGKLQKRGTTFFSGNIIHVFNWKGDFIQELELNQEVLSISCSGDVLYALYEGEEGYDIARFKHKVTQIAKAI